MRNASVTLRSPEHEVLKQVLVLQRKSGSSLAISYERRDNVLVGTHANVDSEAVLPRLELVARDWVEYEFSVS